MSMYVQVHIHVRVYDSHLSIHYGVMISSNKIPTHKIIYLSVNLITKITGFYGFHNTPLSQRWIEGSKGGVSPLTQFYSKFNLLGSF